MKTEHQRESETEPEREGLREAAEEARKILGLRPEATLKDIKRVYRALALKFHPDKMPDVDSDKANEIMKRLNALYEILCDDIELRQNEEEDRLKDEADEFDLVALGDVFLPTLELDVDPIIYKAIQAYQGEYEAQEAEKGQEVDVRVDEVAGKDDKEPGGNIDIKA